MKKKDIRAAAELYEALEELPKTRRALRDKVRPWHARMSLELSAAEMSGGESQGSNSYFYLPVELGEKVLDYVKALLQDELKKLGVKP